ncbi:hypothetical protein J6A31_08930 [bacterium]|nr:hypothetical protein [bacterium]
MAKRETHPSYGMLSFHRCHGGDTALFGSSIKHSNTIRLTLSEGSLERTLNSDFYMSDSKIIEVEMSLSQFTEAITSMNMGSGVPVTIRWKRAEGSIEPCPFIDKHDLFEKELNDNIEKANQQSEELITEIAKLFAEKKSLTKKDKEAIMARLYNLKNTIGSDREFVYSQFNEQMSKSILEAKGEIEAFTQNRIHSIAIDAMKNNIQNSYDMPQIEIGHTIDKK